MTTQTTAGVHYAHYVARGRTLVAGPWPDSIAGERTAQTYADREAEKPLDVGDDGMGGYSVSREPRPATMAFEPGMSNVRLGLPVDGTMCPVEAADPDTDMAQDEAITDALAALIAEASSLLIRRRFGIRSRTGAALHSIVDRAHEALGRRARRAAAGSSPAATRARTA